MLTREQILQGTGGRLVCGGLNGNPRPWRVATDSRHVAPGDLFWALRGPRFDGNDFVAEAMARGAVGAVCDRDVPVAEGRWIIRVEDSLAALWRMAAWQRDRFAGAVVAVTGSVGKTTTREMIHCVLRAAGRGMASQKNYNNEVGLPLSMLAMEPSHDFAVFELGASAPGEIARLAALCRPDIGVIGPIGAAHLAGFGNLERVALTKAELAQALPADGLLVTVDHPLLRRATASAAARHERIGPAADCQWWAEQILVEAGQLSFNCTTNPKDREVSHDGLRPTGADLWPSSGSSHWLAALPPCDKTSFRLPVWGRHHVYAALAAIAVGRRLGLSTPVLRDSLARFRPVAMRCQAHVAFGALVIDDTYNANPLSMQAALELLAELPCTGRRIVVLGEMAELGDESPRWHRQLGREAAVVADALVACGPQADAVAGGAAEMGLAERQVHCVGTSEQAAEQAVALVAPGDVVLVKGSRWMRMENVVQALRRQPCPPLAA